MATKAKTGTKFEPRDIIILTGIFARSNMGQGLPKVELVRQFMKSGTPTVGGSSLFFCQDFMETDEHESMFRQEAQSWVKTLKETSVEEATRIWPDIMKLFNDAKAVV